MKILRFISLTVIFAGICCINSPAQSALDESITSFTSRIKINRDASIIVTESIEVISAGSEIRHGIFRDFPTIYKDRFGNTHKVKFDVLDIQLDGAKEDYHVKSMGNGKRIYIGDKDRYVSSGRHLYTLTYRTTKQLGFFEKRDELYWNVTGNGWIFPIGKASAVIELPDGVYPEVTSVDAYTGYQGARGKNFIVRQEGDRIVIDTIASLGPREGLTISVSWPKGYVVRPTAESKAADFLSDNLDFIIGIVGIVLLLFYYMVMWAHFGKDPSKGTIIPIFNPPDNLSPSDVRYIMSMGYDNKIFTVSIINMAVKGHIEIREDDNRYTLIRKTGKRDSLSDEEAAVSAKLFASTDSLELVNENHASIRSAIDALKTVLKNTLEKNYFLTNMQYFVPGAIMSAVIVGGYGVIKAGEKIPEVLFMCVWLTMWTFGVAALLSQVLQRWKSAFTCGIFSPPAVIGALSLSLFSVPFIIGEIFGSAMLVVATSVGIIPILLSAVFLNIIFYNLLKAPTLAGRKTMDKIEGFRMYLSVAEKERLNLLNPPDETPELFEKYLPYAFALDVEHAWARKFSDILERSAVERGTYTPVWYNSTHVGSWDTSRFISSLGGSFSGAIASSSTPPGSSSGFGGGGSSGGGGGGGGGGGW